MKTKIISPLKKELLIIELPEDGTGYDTTILKDKIISYEVKSGNKLEINLSGYTLLGSPDEIKEEDVKHIVHSDFNEMTDEFFCRDYKSDWVDNFDLLSALESFYSALESEIYWENPYGKTPPINMSSLGGSFGELYREDYKKVIENWHEAQEKTFDRNRSLIFLKN